MRNKIVTVIEGLGRLMLNIYNILLPKIKCYSIRDLIIKRLLPCIFGLSLWYLVVTLFMWNAEVTVFNISLWENLTTIPMVVVCVILVLTEIQGYRVQNCNDVNNKYFWLTHVEFRFEESKNV